MKLPPFSGATLKALTLAAENPATGDAVFEALRHEAGISAMLAVPIEADDEYPVDARPLAAPPRERG